jgi:hypothetical protein
MHVHRMVRIACALAAWLGAVETPLGGSLEEDAQAQALAREVENAFLGGIDLDSMRAARHRFILAAKDSTAGRVAYVLRHIFTPTLDDWEFIRLPAGIRGLYPAVRLLRLATQKD